MSQIQLIEPSPRLPLSSATVHQGMVYVSGQVGFRPGTTELVSNDVADQCQQTLVHIERILSQAGTTKNRILRCGVFLKHIEHDFPIMNRCYAEWLGDHRPARTT